MKAGMIDRDAWHIVEIIIRRYPISKKEYSEYIDQVMASSINHSAGVNFTEDYINPQSVTEAKALKMTSKRAERLKKEIGAVELAYNSLKPEEQKVIKIRFWSDRRRNMPYTKIDEVAYSGLTPGKGYTIHPTPTRTETHE